MKKTATTQISNEDLSKNLAEAFASNPYLTDDIFAGIGYDLDDIYNQTLEIVNASKCQRRIEANAQSEKLIRDLRSRMLVSPSFEVHQPKDLLLTSLSRGGATAFAHAFHRKFEGMNESDKNSVLNDEALLTEWEDHYSPTKPPELSNPEDLISYFGITDPKDIDLRAIAFECNVLIEEKQIDGAVGRLVCRDLTGLISVNSNTTEIGRKRFTIAHELGHFMMHRSQALTVCKNPFREKNPLESEANKFAASLLMPRNLFRARCDANLFNCNILSELAHAFDASLTATALQYSEIGPVPIAVIFSKAGKICWSKISEGLPLTQIKRSHKIPEKSVAASCYNRGMSPNGPTVIHSNVWFDDSQSSQTRIFEDCVYMPSYESVLSIIWMHNG